MINLYWNETTGGFYIQEIGGSIYVEFQNGHFNKSYIKSIYRLDLMNPSFMYLGSL